MENIAHAQRHIRRCLGQHLVSELPAGAVLLNLGEYPCRKPWDPDDWDERALDELQAHGIRLIQVHEEWNDSQRLFGSHKLAALNPAGFRRFVEMVHRRGMRLIVYVSSGYFDRKDPDFGPSGPCSRTCARSTSRMPIARRPARGGGPILSHLVRILDDYGVDGVYNDLGYMQPGSPDPRLHARDEVLAFEESPVQTAPWRISWG